MSEPLAGAHPSELEFDLALVDTASAQFAAHLSACARCRDRLDRLRREQTAFAQSDEPRQAARVAAAWQQKRALVQRRRWLWLPALTAVAAAALLLLLPRPPAPIRTKGGPRVTLFVKQPDGTARPWTGAALQPGDAVQLEIDPAGFTQAAVFSVDAQCQVALEHRQTVAGVALIAASWTLFGRDGGERLYVTFSTGPVAAETLAAALRRARACDSDATPDLDGADFIARGMALRPRAHP
jgi:hypothetical protein